MNELQLKMYQYKTKLKLTNKEIAKRTGYSVATIDRIASGKIKCPKLTTIRKIAQVLEISPEELIGGDVSVEPYFFDKKTASIAQSVKNNPALIELCEICQNLSKDEIETIVGMVKILLKKDTQVKGEIHG